MRSQCTEKHSCLETGHNVGCKIIEFFLALVQEAKVAFEGGKDQCSAHNRDIVAFAKFSLRSTNQMEGLDQDDRLTESKSAETDPDTVDVYLPVPDLWRFRNPLDCLLGD